MAEVKEMMCIWRGPVSALCIGERCVHGMYGRGVGMVCTGEVGMCMYD